MKSLLDNFKHWFIAYDQNGYRPHALRHKWLNFYTVGLLLTHYLTFGVAVTGTIIKDPENFSKDIITYTNEERVKKNLATLSENNILDKAAKEKLDDMIKNNYWDHVSPDGTEAWYFIDKEGYQYTLAGENLARGFAEPKNTVKAWMGSKSHRENMLKDEYTEIGVASKNGYIGDKETTLVVQLFGKPGNSYAEGKTLILGQQASKPTLSLKNAFKTQNIPYISLWLMIFVFMILDARMLKKLGLHKRRYHKFQLRMLVMLNVALVSLLLISFSYIA